MNPRPKRPSRATGFTLVELSIAMAITVVLVAVAVPPLGAMVARKRLDAAVHNLKADISLARQEAGRRGQAVHIHFQAGNPWCYSLGTGPAVDCLQGEPRTAAGTGLVKLVRGSDQPGVQLLQATSMAIDARTGGSLRAESMASFASAEGQQLQLRLTALGHTSVCAPAAPVSGVPPCPASRVQ